MLPSKNLLNALNIFEFLFFFFPFFFPMRSFRPAYKELEKLNVIVYPCLRNSAK